MKKEYSKIYVILLALNITCLLISNIVSIKIVNLLGVIITAGDMLFPITYILNDVFSEVYGYNKAKSVIWISFLANLLMVILFEIVIYLPSSYEFQFQDEVEIVLGSSAKLLIASFLAFIVGNISNAIVLSKLKVKTKGKYLALRTITSTIIGEGLDTLIFIPIVFYGDISVQEIIKLILNVFFIKVMLEVLLTPLTYKVIDYIKKKEDIDVFDNDLKYKIL